MRINQNSLGKEHFKFLYKKKGVKKGDILIRGNKGKMLFMTDKMSLQLLSTAKRLLK